MAVIEFTFAKPANSWYNEYIIWRRLENCDMDQQNEEKEQKIVFIEEEKKERKTRNKKIGLLLLVSFLSSVGLVAFALNWQDYYDMLAFCNAFYFSGFIMFFVGWIILMTNMNILSPIVFGLKTFFLMFSGKKSKVDYYTYCQDRKEHPIPAHIVLTPFLACIPNFAVAIILHILLG